MDRLTVFWVALAISLAFFFAGLANKIAFWSQGRLWDRQCRPIERAKAWHALRMGLGTLFGRQGRRAGRTLVSQGLLHRSLWREDRLRWFAHFLLLAGFLALFTLSTITGFFEEILYGLLGIDTALGAFITNKDTPLMALLNEALGLVILAGLILVAYRRYVRRPAQLRTSPFDTSTLVLLALIMLTSYPTEAFRLLMENTPPALAWYSFIGYPLALLLRPLHAQWEIWHYALFMLHIASCIALLVSMPFSKFFHVAISPLVATANAISTEEVAQ